LYRDGIIAGVLGAATVAMWFFIVDIVTGRPLFTPMVLGTALFRSGAGVETLAKVPISVTAVVMFTIVHGVVFVVIGLVTSVLLAAAERHPRIVVAILLLFVLEFGFNVAAILVAEPVLRVLTWPSILAANLLAAAVMMGYFWLRTRSLDSR
jgi:hypothetical protein